MVVGVDMMAVETEVTVERERKMLTVGGGYCGDDGESYRQ